MRVFRIPARTGDVIVTKGSGNAPGAGGTISTVIVTDEKANGSVSDGGGYSCRDATPAEIARAEKENRISTHYC